MKTTVKWVFSVVILGSFMLSLLPTPGQCGMISGLVPVSCAAPCCTTTPMPRCPLLKAATPRHFIATAAPIFESTLVPLHSMPIMVVLRVRFWSAVHAGLYGAIEMLFAGPVLAVRAPPLETILLSA